MKRTKKLHPQQHLRNLALILLRKRALKAANCVWMHMSTSVASRTFLRSRLGRREKSRSELWEKMQMEFERDWNSIRSRRHVVIHVSVLCCVFEREARESHLYHSNNTHEFERDHSILPMSTFTRYLTST